MAFQNSVEEYYTSKFEETEHTLKFFCFHESDSPFTSLEI